MNPFDKVDPKTMKKALKDSNLPMDTDTSQVSGKNYHSLMENLANSIMQSFQEKGDEDISMLSWIESNINTLVENYIALEVYEKTLSHKVMPTEDWKIDIRSIGLNKDTNEWIYDWQVLVDTQPAMISGNMAISFATVVSICMKAALSR